MVNINKNIKKIKIFSGFVIKTSTLLIIIAGVIFGGILVYGANEYSKVVEHIKSAESLSQEEKYNDAVENLKLAQISWFVKSLGVKKGQINNEITKNEKLFEDKSEYNQGLEEFNQENLEDARAFLSKVSEISPYYQDAKKKTEEAQQKITEKQIVEAVEKATEETRKSAEEAQKAAEQRTKEETAKRIQEEQARKKAEQEAQKIIAENNIANVIQEWQPSVVFIECSWRYVSGGYFKKAGSGLFLGSSSMASVITNRHVAEVPDVGGAEFCIIEFSGGIETIIIGNKNIKAFDNDIDAVVLQIVNPTPYISSLFGVKQACLEIPMIGEKIVILGYPSIGATGGITATEGIVSGYDGDYYITSAKIDEGNSGGIAIWVKENCNLGIPTWVKIGKVESLGRILDFKTLFRGLLQ